MTERAILTVIRAELMGRKEFTEYVDSVFEEIRAEALMEAKEAIKNDLVSFRDHGRRDPKGHIRAIMLIDKILANKQEEKNV